MHAKLRLDLVARLSALPALECVGVVWQPSHIGQGAPLLVLRLITDQRDLSHGGGTGLAQARVQFDSYALDPADAQEVRDEVLNNLHGFRGALIPSGETFDSCAHDSSLEDFDQPSGLSQASCDLIIQYHLPAST